MLFEVDVRSLSENGWAGHVSSRGYGSGDFVHMDVDLDRTRILF